MSLYILDTDCFSLWQRNHPLVIEKVQENCENLAITIITAEELIRGRLHVIRRASQSEQLVLAYTRLWETLEDLKLLKSLKFDQKAGEIYTKLRSQKIRIGTQDLRIAAIVLANHSVLISRNSRDFGRVQGLRVEDWTQPLQI